MLRRRPRHQRVAQPVDVEKAAGLFVRDVRDRGPYVDAGLASSPNSRVQAASRPTRLSPRRGRRGHSEIVVLQPQPVRTPWDRDAQPRADRRGAGAVFRRLAAIMDAYAPSLGKETPPFQGCSPRRCERARLRAFVSMRSLAPRRGPCRLRAQTRQRHGGVAGGIKTVRRDLSAAGDRPNRPRHAGAPRRSGPAAGPRRGRNPPPRPEARGASRRPGAGGRGR